MNMILIFAQLPLFYQAYQAYLAYHVPLLLALDDLSHSYYLQSCHHPVFEFTWVYPRDFEQVLSANSLPTSSF